MKNCPARSGKLKIVVFGPYHAGKTSYIHSIDPLARHIEARSTNGTGTTVALDFGRTMIGSFQVYLFGTPGQDRFEFVRELVAKDLDSAILLIDATAGVQPMHHDLLRNLRKKEIPVAILVTKFTPQHISRISEWKKELEEEVVQGISALDPVSCRQTLEALVHRIYPRKN